MRDLDIDGKHVFVCLFGARMLEIFFFFGIVLSPIVHNTCCSRVEQNNSGALIKLH